MSGLRGYSVYRNFHLYLPLEDELTRSSGGFQVHAVISRYPHSNVHRIEIPQCVAADAEEAMRLSMTYAMRMADDGWLPADESDEAGSSGYRTGV